MPLAPPVPSTDHWQSQWHTVLTRGLHKTESFAVEEALVAELEGRNHEERHERQCHEGSAERRSKFLLGELIDPAVLGRNRLAIRGSHDAGHWERQNRLFPVMHSRNATLVLDDQVYRAAEIGVVSPNRQNIMRIVSDGGGNRASADSKPPNETQNALRRVESRQDSFCRNRSD